MNPITREEFFLAKAAGQSVPDIEPITRKEFFMAKAAGQSVPDIEPKTREEHYLNEIAAHGGGGGGVVVRTGVITSMDYDTMQATVAMEGETVPGDSNDGLVAAIIAGSIVIVRLEMRIKNGNIDPDGDLNAVTLLILGESAGYCRALSPEGGTFECSPTPGLGWSMKFPEE